MFSLMVSIYRYSFGFASSQNPILWFWVMIFYPTMMGVFVIPYILFINVVFTCLPLLIMLFDSPKAADQLSSFQNAIVTIFMFWSVMLTAWSSYALRYPPKKVLIAVSSVFAWCSLCVFSLMVITFFLYRGDKESVSALDNAFNVMCSEFLGYEAKGDISGCRKVWPRNW